MINACLKKNGTISSKDVDLIASHGQTVYHAPKDFTSTSKNSGMLTLQIGDGGSSCSSNGYHHN
jgi:anhydro-N-acetylmuramic acid kinase